MLAYEVVIDQADHHDLAASRVVAFAQERGSLSRLESVRSHDPSQPLVYVAARLVRGNLL